MDLQPLSCDGRTVGYLGLLKPRGIGDIIDHHQLRFAREQRRSFALIAVLVAAGAALLSFPLSRRMVKRITTLAAATNQLAAGQYDIRVPSRTSDELGRLGRDFNTLAQTLENNEQLRRRWVADISHELRTPLAVLRGEIEAVQDGVRQLTPHTLEQLRGEVLRLERLVTDLYELSLTDIGALQYRKSDIDLAEILQGALATYRPKFADHKLALEDELLPAGSVPLFGDPERLQQLFANLLENALRYTDAGGRLRVAMERTKHRITLNFQDSAPGVPESAMERLFDRLYRVEGSRSRAHGGAGLGLALCKNIVEAHKGTISARPSPLGGLWIAITFPLNG
jgi:two-component system sensor histidine kinase BaeS